MSNEGEIKLAHDEYVEANNINVNELPNELVAKYGEIDKMYDDYVADESDSTAAEDALVKASADLKVEIQAWHEAKIATPEPIVDPTPATPAPDPTPIVDANPEPIIEPVKSSKSILDEFFE